MTRQGSVKVALDLLAACCAIVATACGSEGDPAGPEREPGFIIAPNESQLGSFTLSGEIRIGTGECNGNPAQLRDIADLPLECYATSPPGNTCYFIWRGDNVATSDIAPTLGASVPNAPRPYSVLLNRASLVADVETLIDWKAGHRGFNTRPYHDIRFGGSVTPGSSRILRYDSGVVASPDVGADIKIKNLPGIGFPDDQTNPANLASVQFEVRTPWSSDTDDVVMLTINMTDNSSPRTYSQFSNDRCVGAGRNSANTGFCQALGAQTARTTDRFIREYVQSDGSILSGNTLGDANTVAQLLRAELLVVPGRDYAVEFRAQLRDDIVITTNQTLSASLTPPCAVLDLSAADPSTCPACIVARPNHAISGNVWLYAPDTDGVRATRYANTFISDDPDEPMVGLSAGGTQIWIDAPADGGPALYSWNGVNAGRYQMSARSRNTGSGFVDEGHVALSWGTARPLTPFGSFPPQYRWPRAGALPVGETFGLSLGLDASGHSYVGDLDEQQVINDEQQVVNRFAQMGYIQGRVGFVGGCDLEPGIIVTGSAEFVGVGDANGAIFLDERLTERATATGNLDALARGLFNAGDHPTAPGEFEVAATIGTWREVAYRLQLSDGDGYNGSLFIWPSDATEVTLSAPGRGSENTAMIATPREIAVTKVGLTLKVSAGQEVRFPRVEIGNDTRVVTSFPGRVLYTDLNSNPLGAFVGTATGGENSDGDWTKEKLQILVMANSTVDFVPVADVRTQLADGSWTDWQSTPFPAKNGIELLGSCGVCFDENNQQIEDTDGFPTLDVAGDIDLDDEAAQLAEQPAGTETLAVSGTIDDDTPVDWSVRDSDGQVIDSGEGTSWSATLTGLESGDTTFTIVVEDCVGNTTTMPLLIRVAEPLCPAPETPDMCELGENGAAAIGSAFFVNVRGPGNVQQAILCTVAAPGQAATCDTTLLPAQCGN